MNIVTKVGFVRAVAVVAAVAGGVWAGTVPAGAQGTETTRTEAQQQTRTEAETRTRTETRQGAQGQAEPIYAREMMTRRERQAYQKQMRDASSDAERERIRAEHRERMDERRRVREETRNKAMERRSEGAPGGGAGPRGPGR